MLVSFVFSANQKPFVIFASFALVLQEICTPFSANQNWVIVLCILLVLLFELLSIGKYKTENQINIYLMSIVIGQKSTNQITQYMEENWRVVFICCYQRQKAFCWFSESIQTLSKMTFLEYKDFFTSPDFCTVGVDRYAYSYGTFFLS